MKRTGQTGIVGIAYKAPKGLHEDTYALQVLSKILADGKTSRLNKLIIDKGLATSIFMYDFPFLDNGLFITYAFLTPGIDHKEVEKIIINEYNNITESGVSKEEVERAQAQIRATVAFSRDGTYAVASALNEAIAIGDWTFYTNFMDNISNVTEEKIKEVVKKYFTEDQSTTGWFIAKEPKV